MMYIILFRILFNSEALSLSAWRTACLISSYDIFFSVWRDFEYFMFKMFDKSIFEEDEKCTFHRSSIFFSIVHASLLLCFKIEKILLWWMLCALFLAQCTKTHESFFCCFSFCIWLQKNCLFVLVMILSFHSLCCMKLIQLCINESLLYA